MDWDSIIITALICLTVGFASTNLRSCAEASEKQPKVLHNYNYDCTNVPAPPERGR